MFDPTSKSHAPAQGKLATVSNIHRWHQHMHEREVARYAQDLRKTSRGEIVRFCCYMAALALQPGTPLHQMGRRVRGPKDIYPPPAMGQYGIGENRC